MLAGAAILSHPYLHLEIVYLLEYNCFLPRPPSRAAAKIPPRQGKCSMPTDSADTVRARVFRALDGFAIEVPSWGFANTGTRFGKFAQPGGGHHHRGEVR